MLIGLCKLSEGYQKDKEIAKAAAEKETNNLYKVSHQSRMMAVTIHFKLHWDL